MMNVGAIARKLSLCLLLAVSGFGQSSWEFSPTTAPRGATVLLVGNGASNVSSVQFPDNRGGFVAAEIRERSTELLELTVPLAAISGMVEVRDAGSILAVVPFSPATDVQWGIVTTIGPTGVFGTPSAIAVDPASGAAVVSDSRNHRILRVTASGTVSVLAGTGHPGWRDGDGTLDAQFKAPEGVSFLSDGSVLVADTGNHLLRKIDRSGAVSTVAGNGSPGFVNGPAMEAQLNQPVGVAISPDGSIWVADQGNHVIRKVDGSGNVTTAAGTGNPGGLDGESQFAEFHQPTGIQFGPDGTLFVSDRLGHTIRRVSDGIVATIAGNGTPAFRSGGALASSFHHPAGLALQDGRLIIADSLNHSIRSFDPGLETTMSLAGSGRLGFTDGHPSVARFKFPVAVAELGALWIADSGNGSVRAALQHLAATHIFPQVPVAGSSIRVFGSGFAPGFLDVRLGFESLTWEFVSSSMIRVQLPEVLTGNYDLHLSTPAGSVALPLEIRPARELLHVTIQLPSATLLPGQEISATLLGTYSDATTEDLTTSALWSVSDTAILELFGLPGQVRAAEAGVAVLTASYESLSAAVQITVASPDPLPPDPESNAPLLDSTRPRDFAESVAFLYGGPQPTQRDCLPGAIERSRVAILRGRVVDDQDTPVPGVSISIHGAPDVGYTLSRADGEYDIAANGGGVVVVVFQKDGFITAHRRVATPWQDFVSLPDARLLRFAESAREIDLPTLDELAVQGPITSDHDGTRRAVVVFSPGTTATMRLPDGTTQPLSKITVRATEQSVGTQGAMPAELPPESGYTYCVELSVDEAVNRGASRVDFSKPVAVYVENFLGFRDGSIVPAGYYDRDQAQWIASENGRVIRILAVDSGVALVDTDGDGVPDDPMTVGMPDEERRILATLYSAGQSLWRVPVNHFTPWDFNWPYGPPVDAAFPSVPEPDTTFKTESPFCQAGSVIDCESLSIGKSIPVPGTPYSLEYRSRNADGYSAAGGVEVILRTGALPPSVKRIDLSLEVAGKKTDFSYAPSGSLTHSFVWDGTDAYGRSVVATSALRATIGYVYDGVYLEPNDAQFAFGALAGAGTVTGVRARRELTLSREFFVPISGARPDQGLGGWTLNAIHAYDRHSQTVLLGSGGNMRLAARGALQEALPSQDSYPHGVIAGPDGSLYTFSAVSGQLIRVKPDGTRVRIAGWASGEPRDGASAYTANLDIRDVALLPNGEIVVLDDDVQKIFKIENGLLRTLAQGTSLRSLASSRSGALYFIDEWKVKRVDAGGGISIVAEHPKNKYRKVRTAGDVIYVQVSEATSCDPYACSYAERLYRLHLEGEQASLIPPNDPCNISDHGDFAVAPSGRVFYWPGYSCNGSSGLRVIETDGLVYPFSSNPPITGTAITVLPNGEVATLKGNVAACGGSRPCLFVSGVPVRSLSGGGSAVSLPSGESAFVFSALGKHTETRHPVTGAAIHKILYEDTTGLPVAIVDRFGNATTIERSAAGEALAIVGPKGDRTGLRFETGQLTEIASPSGVHRFTYTADGLLSDYRNPRGLQYSYEYDSRGRLRRASDPAGGWREFSYQRSGNARTVVAQTSEGRTWTYVSKRFDDGASDRTKTSPDGLTTKLAVTPANTTENSPDGTRLTLTRQPDPVWNLGAPVVSAMTLRVPSGRTFTLGRTRTVSLGNSSDPFSITSTLDSISVNGRTTTNTYTAADRRERFVSAGGRLTESLFDVSGKLVQHTAPGQVPIRYEYDDEGRLVTVRQGLQVFAYSWNDRGQLASIQGPREETLSFAYDEAGRVTGQTLPDGRNLAMSWDANGNLASIRPPGRSPHLIEYSPVDLFAGYVPPALGSEGATLYEYNRDRELVRITRPDASEMSLVYGANHRLSSFITPLGTTQFTYAATGNLASIVSTGSPTLTYAWDGFLPTSVSWSGSVNGSVAWTWDNEFRIASEKVGTLTIPVGYDADSLITSVGAMAITRDPASGRVTATSLGNTFEEYGYDIDGRLLSYVARHGATEILRLVYQRDISGRIMEKREARYGLEFVEAYAYDSGGRLESVRRNGELEAAYEYDSNGNRLSKTTPASTEVGSYDDQDRLLVYAGSTLTYTPNGELRTLTESGATTTLSYDALSNLRSVVLRSGAVVEYVIDGQNRRVGKKVDGVLIKGWLYRNQMEPVAEFDGSGAIVSRFVYGTRMTVPDYMIRGGVTYRIVSDHLGSVRYVVDASTGVIAQTITYDEFGVVIQDTNPGFQPFGFAGSLWDADVELNRVGAREYWPKAGRWTTKDPIMFRGGDTNLYSYALANPVNFVDPDGLQTVFVGSQWTATAVRGNALAGGVVGSRDGLGFYESSGPKYTGAPSISAGFQIGLLPGKASMADLEAVDFAPGFDLSLRRFFGASFGWFLDQDGNLIGGVLGGSIGCDLNPSPISPSLDESTTTVTSFSSLWAALERNIRKLYGVPRP